MHYHPILRAAALVALTCACWESSSPTPIAGAEKTDPQSFDAQMQPILESYLKIGDALARDSADGVKAHSRRISKLAPKLDASTAKGKHAKLYKSLPSSLGEAARTLSQADTLRAMRASYEKLSIPMVDWASNAKPEGVEVLHCPMAEASWLQSGGPVRNPYYGSKMLRCGEVVKSK